MNLKFILLFLVSLISIPFVYNQSFEGCIIMHVITDQIDKSTKLTVKGKRSLLEAEVDSNETIRVIRDRESGFTTLLRHKDDMKYGLKHYGQEEDFIGTEEIKWEGEFEVEQTNDVKSIGDYTCNKFRFKSPHRVSEAWITKELDIRLSHYFPEFLERNDSEELQYLRHKADAKGFIMSYREQEIESGKDLRIELEVLEKEVPDHVFYYGAEYIILDEEGLKQLYLDSRNDDQKKRQLEEFFKLFSEE